MNQFFKQAQLFGWLSVCCMVSQIAFGQANGTNSPILTAPIAKQYAALGSVCYCPNCTVVPCTPVGGSGLGAGSNGSCSSCSTGGGLSVGGRNFNRGLPVNYKAVSTHPEFPQLATSSSGFSEGSLIMNGTMEFFHWGWDVTRNNVDEIGLMRMHRPRDMAKSGSFGPGVFSNFDHTLTCTLNTSSQIVAAELFDPQTSLTKYYVRHSNYATYTNMGYTGPIPNFEDMVSGQDTSVYGSQPVNQLPSTRERLKRVRLLDSNQNALTTTSPVAAYVSMEAFDGSRVIFKLFDVGLTGTRIGRLYKTVSSTGATTTVTFKTWTAPELAASPTRAYQIDRVTDRFGRQLVFTYSSTQVGGAWVVSQVATPFGGSVSYSYSGGQLSQATLLTGATASFTPGYDAAVVATTVAINDPSSDPGHQRKTVYLSAQGSGSTYYVTIPLNGIRMMTNANDEVTYLSVRNTAADQIHYEGGGRAKWYGNSTLNTYASYFQPGWAFNGAGTGVGGMSTSFSGTLDPIEYQNSDAGSGATLTNTVVTDEAGRSKTYVSDELSRTIFVKYADGTFEAYCYNDFSEVTRFRNRLGEVTKKVYDTAGRLIEEHVGLKENTATNTASYNTLSEYNRCPTDDVQQPEYAVRKWEYVPTGQPGAGMLAAEIDELGNRRDYHYNAQGRVSEILEPAMVAGGPRATTQYTYTASGLLASETDPDGHIVNYIYDGAGRILTTLYADGSTEAIVYGTNGNATDRIQKKIDRGGVVTEYTYDATGRTTQVIQAIAVRNTTGQEILTPLQASTKTFEYVPGSQQVWKSRENGALTEYINDHRGRVVQVKKQVRVGLELVDTRTYKNGQLISTTDNAGRKTFYAYDSTDGRLARTIKATVPQWEPPTTSNSDLLVLSRSLVPNAHYVILDEVCDAAGRIADSYDGRQIQTHRIYDSRGRIRSECRAYGTTLECRTETIYDAASNIVELRSPRYFDSTDINGYLKDRESWTYNGRKLPVTHWIAAGTTEGAGEGMSYDLKGRIISRIDFRGKSWSTSFDTCCDHGVAQSNPLGHGIIRNTNSRGLVVHTAIVADVNEHLADFSSPINSKTSYETTTRFDGRGRPIASTIWLAPLDSVDRENPPIAGWEGVPATNGLTSQFLYDDNLSDGLGLESTAGMAYTKMASTGTATVSISNAVARLASNPSNIGFSSNAPGRAIVSINPQDEVSFTILDASGQTTMSGRLDNYTGSSNSLLAWSIVSTKVTNIPGYGDCLETQTIDALGKKAGSLEDGLGRIVKTTDQAAKATVSTYDANGNRLTVRDPNNTGEDIVYDSLGRPISITDTAGHTSSSSFDKADNSISVIDAKTKSTTYTYDARGRQRTQTDRMSGTTVFSYLPTGQLASVTDPQNQTTLYTYDDAGRKISEQYPDHVSGIPGQPSYGTVTFINDTLGRVRRKQEQSGDTCTYTYDLSGRLLKREYRNVTNSPAGSISDTDSFSYDRAGRILTATSGRYDNVVAYTYDTAGRKKTESLTIAQQTYSIQNAYNSRDEIVAITYPDGSVVNREYTDSGKLSRTVQGGSPIDTRQYDDGGRLISSVYSNGVGETRTYNADNTLSCISFSGAPVGSLTYGWDANKNKVSETISGSMSNFGFTIPPGGYDDEDRLVSYARASGFSQAWSLSSTGDWNSVTTNGSTQSRTYGPAHELLNGSGQSVLTDSKGNITNVPSALRANSSSLLLNWDFDNRLASADVGNNGTIDVTYKFDALGRRVLRQAGTSNTVFVQSDQQTIADYQEGAPAQSPSYRYIYGAYIDEPVLRQKPSNGESIFYHRNQQFSIVALTGSSGAILERYAYTAYGMLTIADENAVVRPASIYNNRFTYTGREWDADLGLYHYRARMYDANLGRFCSRDPIDYEGSQWNLYEMVSSSPLQGYDPLGLFDLSGYIQSLGMQALGACKSFDKAIPFPYGLSVHITGTICGGFQRCCENERIMSVLRIYGSIELYGAWGYSWKSPYKPKTGRNTKVPDPWNPGCTIKNKKLKNCGQPAGPGFRDRTVHGDFGPVGCCPEVPSLSIYGSVFFRGSVGIGIGAQFNIYRNIDSWDDWGNFFSDINAQGSVSGWVVGASVEIGGGVNFEGPVMKRPTGDTCCGECKK